MHLRRNPTSITALQSCPLSSAAPLYRPACRRLLHLLHHLALCVSVCVCVHPSEPHTLPPARACALCLSLSLSVCVCIHRCSAPCLRWRGSPLQRLIVASLATRPNSGHPLLLLLPPPPPPPPHLLCRRLMYRNHSRLQQHDCTT
jgi:hypothetical protein